jgi:N-acetylneuraminic acid mutarotase
MKFYIFFLIVFLQCGVLRAQQDFFQKTTQLPVARQMYGSVVLGKHLYIIGGYRYEEGFSMHVEKAMIHNDGKLGAWEKTTSIPHNRSYIKNSTLVLNDIVYVVCGIDRNSRREKNTILWSKPGAGGHLGAWQESPPYPGIGVNCVVACSTPGYIHVIGGNGPDSVIYDHVWSAVVEQDGSISRWERGPSLPLPLWYHCGGVAAGHVWIWGGLSTKNSNSTNQNLFYAPILSSGKLGKWRKSDTILPSPFYSASSTVSGSYLLSFCPRYSGAVVSNDVWYANVTEKGVLKWEMMPTRLPAKLYIGLATDYRRGHVYIPGGRIAKGQEFDKNVYFIKLAAKENTENSSDSSDGSYSYQYQNRVQGAFPGFMPYEKGRQISMTQRKPLILYLHTPYSRKAKEQASILSKFNPGQLSQKVIFSEIDISNYPQIAQQFGVFRVPSWVFFDAYGNKQADKFGVMPLNKIQACAEYLAR